METVDQNTVPLDLATVRVVLRLDLNLAALVHDHRSLSQTTAARDHDPVRRHDRLPFKGGAIKLRLDSGTGPLIGTLKVEPTGGMDKWENQSSSVTGAEGIHDLYFKFVGGSGALMNFDWWKFE